jgi:hypothetical protein
MTSNREPYAEAGVIPLLIEKNANLVYEIAADVRFGHELGNRKILNHEVSTHERFGDS